MEKDFCDALSGSSDLILFMSYIDSSGARD